MLLILVMALVGGAAAKSMSRHPRYSLAMILTTLMTTFMQLAILDPLPMVVVVLGMATWVVGTYVGTKFL